MNRPGQSLLSRLTFSRPDRPKSKQQQYRASTHTLLGLLAQLRSGHLVLTLPNKEIREFGNKSDQLHAEIQVLDWSVFKQVLSHGDIGFAGRTRRTAHEQIRQHALHAHERSQTRCQGALFESRIRNRR